MNEHKSLSRRVFTTLTWVFFNRNWSLFFCIAFVALSLLLEIKIGWAGLFSASGAVVSLAGLFLNIKYTLNFHLNLPINRLYNKLIGAAILGSNVTPEGERWVKGILLDEVYGVAFMISGTIIWAYGSYLMPPKH